MSLTHSTPLAAAQAAKTASHVLATLPDSARRAALELMAASLESARAEILAANAEDMRLARAAQSNGELSPALVSRLDLSKPGKWEEMVQGVRDVAGLDDPLGKVDLRTKLDEGLVLERVSAPIGVLLVIFEARPEVVANIAALAVKSGNAAILKGKAPWSTVKPSPRTEAFWHLLTFANPKRRKKEARSRCTLSQRWRRPSPRR